ncbi:MAG: SDR family oxidoreductase [Acidobacteriota bacterium]
MSEMFRRKVAVITGASTGIGFQTATALARRGCRTVIGARRKEELEMAAAALRRGGRECRAVVCDVTQPETLVRLREAALERWDQVDFLVANAGIGMVEDFADSSPEDLRQVMEINFHGVVNSIQAVLPHMLERGEGNIVIVSSVLGFRGIPGHSAYCASKFALHGLFESLRSELKDTGVHVLLACPGYTDTPFFENRLGTDPGPMEVKGEAMSAEEVGEAIVKGLAARESRIVLTGKGRLLTRMARHFPRITDSLIDRYFARRAASTT